MEPLINPFFFFCYFSPNAGHISKPRKCMDVADKDAATAWKIKIKTKPWNQWMFLTIGRFSSAECFFRTPMCALCAPPVCYASCVLRWTVKKPRFFFSKKNKKGEKNETHLIGTVSHLEIKHKLHLEENSTLKHWWIWTTFLNTIFMSVHINDYHFGA